MTISYFEPRARELDSLGTFQCERQVGIRLPERRLLETAPGHQFELFAACLQCFRAPGIWLVVSAGLSPVPPFGIWMRWDAGGEDAALVGVFSGWCGTGWRTREQFAALANQGQLDPWEEGIRRLRDESRFAAVLAMHSGHRGPERPGSRRGGLLQPR